MPEEFPAMIRRRHLVAPTVALVVVGLLTACGGDPVVVGTPVPTVTVTVDPTHGATGSAPATSSAPSNISTDPQVQTFVDALDALVAYAQAHPGNLRDDQQFRTLLSAFVQAKRSIDRTDLWLGENSAVTASGLAISAGEAVTIGQGAVRPNATATSVELSNDDTVLTWEIEFSNGDDVEIDANTGAVRDIDLDD
jgi:uncharacterized membrane protein YkoI